MPGPGSQTPFSFGVAPPSSTRPLAERGAGPAGPAWRPRPPRPPSCTSSPPPTTPDPACPADTGCRMTAENITAAAASSANRFIEWYPLFREVLVDQLGHLEHVDGGLAAEHRLQRAVRLDHAAVRRVLELVLLDVCPQPLRPFGARNRLRSDHLGERRARCHGRHERGVRLAR